MSSTPCSQRPSVVASPWVNRGHAIATPLARAAAANARTPSAVKALCAPTNTTTSPCVDAIAWFQKCDGRKHDDASTDQPGFSASRNCSLRCRCPVSRVTLQPSSGALRCANSCRRSTAGSHSTTSVPSVPCTVASTAPRIARAPDRTRCRASANASCNRSTRCCNDAGSAACRRASASSSRMRRECSVSAARSRSRCASKSRRTASPCGVVGFGSGFLVFRAT